MRNEEYWPIGYRPPKSLKSVQKTSDVADGCGLVCGTSEESADLGVVSVRGYSYIGEVLCQQVLRPEAARSSRPGPV